MTAPRVDGDEVDLADGHVWVRNGERFTGTAVDHREDGSELGYTEYRNGIPDGLSRTYWQDGQVRLETWYDYGVKLRERSWYPDGRAREDVVMDAEGVKHHYRWAEDGSVESSFYRGRQG